MHVWISLMSISLHVTRNKSLLGIPIASSSNGKLQILKPLNNDAQKHSLKFKLKKMIKSPMGQIPNTCIHIYIYSFKELVLSKTDVGP